MRLGLYIILSLVIMITVGAFTYTLAPDNYIIEFMGINLNFPIAVWVVLPMLLLFVFTVIYMLVYGIRSYFKLKKWRRDAETLEDALYWSLVKEPKEQKYMMDDIKSSAVLLSKASIDMSDNIEGLSPRLAKVVNIIQKVKNGDYVDFKEEKMVKVFSEGNAILIQNRLNHLESDDKFVEDVMKSSSNYSKTVQKDALSLYAKKTNFEEARKYAKIFDIENFLVLLNRVSAEDDLHLTHDILEEFVKALHLSCADFIKVAKVTKQYLKPDENILLFKNFQDKDEKAQNAYLYLLFEYELLEQVSTYLEEHDENEFMKFRALYDLKRSNSKYKLEDIIDVHSVCVEPKYISS